MLFLSDACGRPTRSGSQGKYDFCARRAGKTTDNCRRYSLAARISIQEFPKEGSVVKELFGSVREDLTSFEDHLPVVDRALFFCLLRMSCRVIIVIDIVMVRAVRQTGRVEARYLYSEFCVQRADKTSDHCHGELGAQRTYLSSNQCHRVCHRYDPPSEVHRQNC